MNNHYYTYAYLREDGTPYYIGKGCRDRINAKYHPGIYLPPKERRIKLKTKLTEAEALKHEIYMISIFGRKDINTGILYNRTDGGDNPPKMTKNNPNHINGCRLRYRNETVEQKQKRIHNISKSRVGNNLPTKQVKINELNMVFPSIRKCAKYINGDPSAVTRCLNKRGQVRHRGYTFTRV